MQAQRPPYVEMVDTKANKSVLGTFSPALIRTARYSLIRAEAFGNQAKIRAILEYMGDTAGLDGRARQDLRDALMGARPSPISLTTTGPPVASDGVPHL